jgi:hypothetical protein
VLSVPEQRALHLRYKVQISSHRRHKIWSSPSFGEARRLLSTDRVIFHTLTCDVKQRASPFQLEKAEENSNAIGTFFSQYPEFDYNYENGVAEEFYRMCDFFNWERDNGEREEARRAFKDAMVVQFNALYGTDITKIENWHRLCVAVCIEPLPTTIVECKEVSEKFASKRFLTLTVSRRSRTFMSTS